jgi:hypothetical protein
MDDQASNYLQYNNLCMGGGLKLQWNRYNTYVNNILVRNASVEITGVWAGSNHYMTRNIFTNGQTYWCNMYNGANIPNTIKANTKLIDSNCIASNGAVNTDQGGVSWTTWHNVGLDVHSVQGDPMFTDTTKTYSNTPARGDFTVRAGSPALTVGFKNFPMDSFGVMPVSTAAQNPAVHATNGLESGVGLVRYCAGRFIVSCDGDFKLTITNALGRTVKTMNGKDNTSIAIRPETMGCGIYMTTVRSGKGIATRKFLVN